MPVYRVITTMKTKYELFIRAESEKEAVQIAGNYEGCITDSRVEDITCKEATGINTDIGAADND